MDRFGITTTVVSLGNPWLDPFSGEVAMELARRLNEELASLESETSGRVVGMGVLPQHDLAAAVDTARMIAESDSLHGIVLGPRICGMQLDDPGLDPLWQVLQVTRTPALFHPHFSDCIEEFESFSDLYHVAIGFPMASTMAVARLVMAGVLERFREMSVVVSHGGGTIPFLAGRLDAVWQLDAQAQERLHSPPSEQLSRLYLDTIVYHERSLRAAADLVGTHRMVFGTDHPFSIAQPDTNLLAISEVFGVDERVAVLSTTAKRVFGL